MARTIQVLHVDDDPDFLGVTARFLEREDDRFEVVSTTNPADALEHLEETRPDCVVSDYEMPERDGIEFLETVREDHPELPFILFTGKGSEAVASDAISAGATDYLQKETSPDQFKVLGNRIENVVQQYRSTRDLERERARMEFALEATDAAVWTRDHETDEMTIHPPVCPVFGTRIESFDALLAEVHARDRDAVEEMVRTAARAEDGFSLQYRFPGEDATRWGELIGRTITGDGEGVYQTGITRDITEQKEQKRRFEVLANNLPGMVYRCGNDRRWPMEDVRGDVAAFTGYTAAELEANRVSWGADVIHPDDEDHVWETVQQAVESDDPFEFTYRIRTREGETRWVWERGRGVFGPSGDIEALEGFITEVTERKRRERDLRRYERRFESLFQDPNILVALLEPDGTVLDVNDTALSYVDIGRDRVVGDPFPDTPWWRPETTADLAEWIERAAAGEYVEFEVRHRASDPGDGFTANGTLRPVTDADGDVVSIIASARDVTDVKRRERQLERQNERFDELASIVSHDLQSPISSVRGRLELAAETGDLEHVERAANALERLDELREDLVETLRSRAVVGDLEVVDVGHLAESAWKRIDTPPTATLEVVDRPEMNADLAAARRLLQNLLSNAVEHADGDGTVRVGGMANGFYVEDDGPGIDPDVGEDVFEPGYTTKPGGTGMGLPSVERIVEAHDWRIDVRDAETLGGARFEITA